MKIWIDIGLNQNDFTHLSSPKRLTIIEALMKAEFETFNVRPREWCGLSCSLVGIPDLAGYKILITCKVDYESSTPGSQEDIFLAIKDGWQRVVGHYLQDNQSERGEIFLAIFSKTVNVVITPTTLYSKMFYGID